MNFMKLYLITVLSGLLLWLAACMPQSSPEAVTCQPFNDTAQAIAKVRTRFNRAISEADITVIREVLADNVILVTGTDSEHFIGRASQLDIWADDFANKERLVFTRMPDCFTISDIHPIAMERGHWRGAKANDSDNHISGEYSAKWRKISDQWIIEAEAFLTTSCKGSLCPADPSRGP